MNTSVPARALRLALLTLSVVLLGLVPGAPLVLAKGAVPVRVEPRNATPTPSGAELAYPLNHTFDADARAAGTPPPNPDFETAGAAIGTPPANSDLAAAATDAGVPTNAGFETGDLSGWTTSGGTVTIQSDTPHGRYASLSGGASLTSSAFTVDPSAQALLFDVGFLSTTTTSWVTVYVLTGADFSTQTQILDQACAACGSWQTKTVNASAYTGQTVKLKFVQSFAAIGIDAVHAQIVFPSYTTAGSFERKTDADGNVWASLGSGGTLTSAAFTVDPTAQFASVRVRGASAGNDQYTIKVLSGAGYATTTQVAYANVDDVWQTVRFNVSAWQGQQVKVQVLRSFGLVGADDIGLQRIEVPQWGVTGAVSLLTGGPTGNYVRIPAGGAVTSAAITLAADLQQVSLAYKGDDTSSSFYFELLRGADFSQVVDLQGGVVTADQTQWKTLKAGVSLYTGETVKLRVRQSFSAALFDNAGLGELAVPGWTLTTTDAAATGSDTNGTYVSPYKSGGAVFLRSATISSGVIDRPNASDQRYFTVAYDIGYSTSNLMQVFWYNAATGQNWTVASDAASTPTGYRTRYFYVADFMGPTGYFVVKLAGGGKVYSIADNIARQQLAEPFSQKVGLAVDTSTGAFALADRDLATEGPLPLVLARYYNGHSDQFGTLGYRWTHSFDTRLTVAQNGDAGVVFGDGREAFFIWSTLTSTFSAADARVHDKLVKNGDATYTFTTTTNLTYRFAADGKLTSVTDLGGNVLTLTYDGGGRLASATAPGSVSFSFTYNADGRLTSVAGPAGATVSYTYDANGDLATATDPTGGTQTYTYSLHRLTRVVDKTGQTLFTNTLDSTNRVTTQTDAAGKTLTITYDTPAKGVTRVTDPLAAATDYYFDGFHRTTDVVDPTGRVSSSTYDGSGNLFKVIDPAANSWTLAYDAGGNVTSVTDPLSGALVMTWNARNQPLSVRDKRGNVTTLLYDAAGNVTQKTDPLGRVWTYTYDARGNQLTATNPLSQTTTNTYDTGNHRLSSTDALGHTWTWTYDAAGRVLTATDPPGNVETKTYDAKGRLLTERNALNQITTYAYNIVGALTTVTDPLGNVTTYVYDGRGLNTSKTDPAGKVTSYTWDDSRRLVGIADPLGRTTTYGYDAASRLASVTDPAGGVTSYAYNTAGRLASERDPLGRTTSYAYNTAGKVTGITAPNGGVTAFGYDADGNQTTVTDALNHVTTTTYDALSRHTTVTDPLTHATTYTYDPAGRLASVANALNQATTYTYDAAGRLTGVANPLNQTTTYTYDTANRRTGVTDPLGRTTTYGYDAADRTTTVTTPAGTTSTTYDAGGRVTRVAQPSGAATTYTYDPRGLLLTTTNPLGQTTSYAFDNAGQQTAMTDPRGVTTSYLYDAAGRQTRITDALGAAVQFTYDLAGQQTAVTNARGKSTTTTYDLLGNVVSTTDPLGRATTNAYDLLGRLTRTTDPRGVIVDYGYDAADRLTSMTYPSGAVSYSYDAAGRRTGMTDPTGTTTWSYDAAGRTTSVTSPQGTVGYTYTAAGQRASMTLPGSRTASYTYDTAGRLGALTDWVGRTTTFGYDTDSRRTTVTRPGNLTTTNVYDAAGRLTVVTHARAGTTLQSFAYTYDAAGNRTSTTGPAGLESYTLDSLGRITSASYPGGASTSYTYDAGGNRLTKTAGGTTTAYSYDDADQLIAEGATTYTYDAAGNLTARGSDAFTWDWHNRLTSAAVGGTTTTYSYDGDDTRIGKTSGTATTTYLWDRQSGLPLLVDDGSAGYVHTDGGVQTQINSASAPKELLTDGLGSVRGAADSSGALTGSADYDVFGAVRGTSTTGSPFGFTGEQTDPETGFVFLRARALDPATGRFLSQDSVQPNAPGTQGYNAYAYVANNPTTWIDPSGDLAGPRPTLPLAPPTPAPRPVSAATGVTVWRAVETIQLAAAAYSGILYACLHTGWCAPSLGLGVSLVSSPSGQQQAAGVAVTAFTAIACAIDIEIRKGAGPSGLQPGDGAHCFVLWDRPVVQDCSRMPAKECRQIYPERDKLHPREAPSPDPIFPQPTGTPLGPDNRDPCDDIGHWGLPKPGGATPFERSWFYQWQVTGRLPTLSFYVNGYNVEFDGCLAGILIEAKGCGYAEVLALTGKPYDERSPGRQTRTDNARAKLIKQARSQAEAARAVGAPLVWVVAEEEVQQELVRLFEDAGITGVSVVHVPPWIPCK